MVKRKEEEERQRKFAEEWDKYMTEGDEEGNEKEGECTE